jgi:hypothetical protein
MHIKKTGDAMLYLKKMIQCISERVLSNGLLTLFSSPAKRR